MKLCGFEAGLDHPFFLIAGPCVIESRQMALDTAGQLKEICAGLGIPFIYKSSYDKANRSSASSFRGFGMEKGLAILQEVKKQIGVPVLTDVHTEQEVAARTAMMEQLRREAGNDGYDYEMLDAAGVRGLLPNVGPRVLGASFTPYDGVANPLFTIRALHTALAQRLRGALKGAG